MVDLLRKKDFMFLMEPHPVRLNDYRLAERMILGPVSAASMGCRGVLGVAMVPQRYDANGNVFAPAFTPPTPGLRIPRPFRAGDLW